MKIFLLPLLVLLVASVLSANGRRTRRKPTTVNPIDHSSRNPSARTVAASEPAANPEQNRDFCTECNASGKGNCMETEEGYQCFCDKYYVGEFCDKDICATEPCDGEHKVCVHDEVINYKCECAHPYFGGNCDKRHCSDDSPCNSNQTCETLDVSPGYVCPCISGNTGSACSIGPCDGKCPEGTCQRTSVPPFYSCQCDLPYLKPECSKTLCDGNPCNGHACIASSDEQTYQCKCQNGYTGDRCENGPCSTKYCGNGVCKEHEQEPFFSCKCTFPFEGPDCRETVCNGMPCVNGGSCTDSTSEPGYSCKCPNGFTGHDCERVVPTIATTTEIPPTSAPPKSPRKVATIGLVTGILLALVILAIGTVVFLRRRKKKQLGMHPRAIEMSNEIPKDSMSPLAHTDDKGALFYAILREPNLIRPFLHIDEEIVKIGFVSSCISYKSSRLFSLLPNRARGIVTDFLAPNPTYRMTLEEDIKNVILQKVGQREFTLDLFDEAAAAVYYDMLAYPVIRFQDDQV